MPLTHHELEQQAIRYLGYRGWLVVRTHDCRHRPSEPGVPDLIALRKGQSLLLELKGGRDKQSDDQRVFAARAARYGIEVQEIRSLEDVMSLADSCNVKR